MQHFANSDMRTGLSLGSQKWFALDLQRGSPLFSRIGSLNPPPKEVLSPTFRTANMKPFISHFRTLSEPLNTPRGGMRLPIRGRVLLRAKCISINASWGKEQNQ